MSRIQSQHVGHASPPLSLRGAAEIYIDVALLLALLLLFSPRLTGLPVHEWLGMALGVPLIIHLVLSWSWIATATARLVTGAGARARINYALNWILFTLVVIEIASGIAISEVALPAIGVSTINDRAWRALHNEALNYSLLLLGLHVAMNWTQLARGGPPLLPARVGRSVSQAGATLRLSMRVLARVACITLSASVIAGAVFLWLGPPALAREYHVKSEIARFAPTAGHGFLQLGGETLLLILVAYAGRRCLRIRL